MASTESVSGPLDSDDLGFILPTERRNAMTLALLERGYAADADLGGLLRHAGLRPRTRRSRCRCEGAVKDWTIRLVPDQVLPALREGGMTEEQEQTMMEENPKRWLA